MGRVDRVGSVGRESNVSLACVFVRSFVVGSVEGCDVGCARSPFAYTVPFEIQLKPMGRLFLPACVLYMSRLFSFIHLTQFLPPPSSSIGSLPSRRRSQSLPSHDASPPHHALHPRSPPQPGRSRPLIRPPLPHTYPMAPTGTPTVPSRARRRYQRGRSVDRQVWQGRQGAKWDGFDDGRVGKG